MARPKNPSHVPPYPKPSPTGRVRIRLQGRDVYLRGPHGSPQSHDHYRRVIAEHLAKLDAPPSGAVPQANSTRRYTIAELFAAYLRGHRKSVGYESLVKRDRIALRRFRQQFGRAYIDEIGPREIKAFRRTLLDLRTRPGPETTTGDHAEAKARPLSRGYINGQVATIARVIRWGTEEGIVPPAVGYAAAAVRPLRFGEAGRESGRREPVEALIVERTLVHLEPIIGDVVRLLMLTGARPGELLGLRRRDIVTTGQVWTATIMDHKCARFGKERVLSFGPLAQAVLRPHLAASRDGEFLFSPVRADRLRREASREERETPITPSELKRRARAERKRAEGKGRKLRQHYTPNSLLLAIGRACKSHGIKRWHPYQLRHLAAQTARDRLGIEAASAMLGHADLDTTLIYSRMQQDRATKAALAIG